MFRAIAVAAIATVLVAAEGMPVFNVAPHCRTVATLGVTDANACLREEQVARQQLAREWAEFTPAEKSECRQAASLGDPTYTALLSCLELSREARKRRSAIGAQ
jgi:hypothetical protein